MNLRDSLRARRSPAVAVAVAATVFGCAIRLPGLASRGLFFDDAWIALPARVPLRLALHMMVTAPGFTLLERTWINLGPGGTHWALLLPFLIGIALPPLVFALTRYLGYAPWACATVTVAAAICPAAVEYSTRIKEYNAAALLSMALLALGERCYRSPSWPSHAALAACSVIAVGTTATILPVVLGSWAALLLRSLAVGRAKAVLGWASGSAVLVVPVLLVELHWAPKALRLFWVHAERLVSNPLDLQQFVRTAAGSTAGLAHGLLGLDVPFNMLAEATVLPGPILWFSLLGLAAVLALAAAGFALWRRWRAGEGLGALGAWCSVVAALGGWAAGFLPLGTGRVDIFLVPSLLVLSAWACSAAGERLGGRVPRASAWALAGLAGLSALAMGWHFRAWYPSQDLTGLEAKVAPLRKPSDLTIVSYSNTYTWAFEGRSAWYPLIKRNATSSFTVGYSVVLSGPRYLAAEANPVLMYGPPNPFVLAYKAQRAKRVWLVGISTSAASPSTWRNKPETAGEWDDGTGQVLAAAGWHRGPKTWRAPGVWAALFERPSKHR